MLPYPVSERRLTPDDAVSNVRLALTASSRVSLSLLRLRVEEACFWPSSSGALASTSILRMMGTSLVGIIGIIRLTPKPTDDHRLTVTCR